MTTRKCPCVADCSRDPNRTDERADPKCNVCGGTGELKIRTTNERPPIPTTAFDWSAWVDGSEEDGPHGCGPTKKEAIDALLERIAAELE